MKHQNSTTIYITHIPKKTTTITKQCRCSWGVFRMGPRRRLHVALARLRPAAGPQQRHITERLRQHRRQCLAHDEHVLHAAASAAQLADDAAPAHRLAVAQARRRRFLRHATSMMTRSGGSSFFCFLNTLYTHACDALATLALISFLLREGRRRSFSFGSRCLL